MYKPEAFIFDMDGTLANVQAIRHYVITPENKPKKWSKNFEAFHEESANVPVNPNVKNELLKANESGYKILIVTARMHKYRHHTAWFLALNNIPSDALYMRKNNDYRKDYIVKYEILQQIKKRYTPIHAFDDNPAVIKLWEEHNIKTTIVPGWMN